MCLDLRAADCAGSREKYRYRILYEDFQLVRFNHRILRIFLLFFFLANAAAFVYYIWKNESSTSLWYPNKIKWIFWNNLLAILPANRCSMAQRCPTTHPRLEIHPRKRLGLLNIRWGGSIVYRYAGLSSINFAANRGERLLLLTTGTVLVGPRSSGYFVKSRLEEGSNCTLRFISPFHRTLTRGWSTSV